MTNIATDLATLLNGVNRHGDFHASGIVEIFPPGLEVGGIGPIALPLLPVQAEQLIAVASQAPYGRGDQTIIDTEVRRTWQINADQVAIRGRAWAYTLKDIVTRVAEGLGVAELITAELYKLLVYDHSQTLSDWHRPDGGDPGLGPLPFDETELSPPEAFEELVPTEQSFHEATGNEGASFERTYRRAALVLWPRSNRLAVLSQGGLEATLPTLAEMAEGCGTDCQSPTWAEAHTLSALMLESWPHESNRSSEFTSPFLFLLCRLGDVERIDAFLAKVPAAGIFAKVDAEAVARALALLPPARSAELAERIVVANAEKTLDACANLLAKVAAEPYDLRPVALALIAALPGGPARPELVNQWGLPQSMSPDIAVDLLGGIGRIAEDLADDALDTLLAWPKCWDPDAVLVPALLILDRAAPTRLRDACRDHLRTRIALPLAPPNDWRRDTQLTCSCAHCRELGSFLADPAQKEWTFRAVQAGRSHVEAIIRSCKCDLDLATLKKGSPHSLICTKNQASYHQRVRQREVDLQTLARIEAL